MSLKRFVCVAMAFCFLCACQREEILPERHGVAKEFIAFMEECKDSTKTALNDESYLVWLTGDQLAIFRGSTVAEKFQVKESAVGTTNGAFSKVTESSDDFISGGELAVNVAIYPYVEDMVCSAGAIEDEVVTSYKIEKFNIPSVQSYVDRNIPDDSFAMVAVTESVDDNVLKFKNVCGAFRLQLTGTAKVRSIVLSGNNGELIAGSSTVTAYLDGSVPTIEVASDASTSITLDCGEGVQLDEEQLSIFTFSLPPTTFTKGFTVVVNDVEGGVGTLSTSMSYEVPRSAFLQMAPISVTTVVPEVEVTGFDYIDKTGVNHGPGVTIDGVVWAPVNCDYEPADSDKGYVYGKMFQWGRMYGQGYHANHDAEGKANVQGPVAFATGQLEENAGKFYYTDADTDNWFNDVADIAGIWNAGTEAVPVKSEYDPCPAGWRVPTSTEMNGLVQNFSWGHKDGLNGMWFSGSAESASAADSVFFPAGGWLMSNKSVASRASYGFYWCSTIASSGYPVYYTFYEAVMKMPAYSNRGSVVGYNIRCVMISDYDGELEEENVPVTSIIFAETSVGLGVGDSYTLSAVVGPDNATDKTLMWSVDDADVVQVDQSGKVVAIAEGTAVVTAHADGITASCTFTVTGKEITSISYIDEYGVNRGDGVTISGVIWAPVNCGYKPASSTERGYPYGKLYQWGRRFGFGYSTTYDSDVPSTAAGGSVTVAEGNGDVYADVFFTMADSNNLAHWFVSTEDHTNAWNTGTADLPVKSGYDPCPSGWRMPTSAELKSLMANSSSWTSLGDANGYWMSGSSAYAEGTDAIFLPAAGGINQKGAALLRNSAGRYWASSLQAGGYVQYLSFNSSTVNVYGTGSVLACSVRCVLDQNEGEENVAIESMTLSRSALSLLEGDSFELGLAVTPSAASIADVVWSSSDASVAYVDQYGKVTAVAAGAAVITVASGEVSASCTVTVYDVSSLMVDYVDEAGVNHGKGVVVDDVIWAPVNCGYEAASSAEKGYGYGKYYQWGRKYGSGCSSLYDTDGPEVVEGPLSYYDVAESAEYEGVLVSMSSSSDHWFSTPEGSEELWYSALWNAGMDLTPVKTIYDPCPDGWRLPSYDELSSLSQNRSGWTSFNGQNGFWYSGAAAYTDGVQAVFMPAGGFLNHNGEVVSRAQLGRYWVSDLSASDKLCFLLFGNSKDSSGTEMEVSSMSGGGAVVAATVRCVQETE